MEQVDRIYMETEHINNAYREIIAMLFEVGSELEEMSNNKYELQDTLEKNETLIRNLLKETSLGKKLEQIKLKYEITDMKSLLNYIHVDDEKKYIEKLITQYELNDRISKLEDKYISFIGTNLSLLFDDNIFLKEYTDNSNDKELINIIEKTPEQIVDCHQQALTKIKRLFSHKEISENTYYKTIELTDKLFDNYLYGHKKLPLKRFRERKNKISSENNFVI